MTDYLGYILVRFLSFIFCRLPVSFGLMIGRGVGLMAYRMNRKRKIIAYTNLKAAFCKEMGPARLRQVIKGVYKNLGMVFVEVLRFPVTDKRYMDSFVDHADIEKLRREQEKKNGMVLLTAHFGNWELSGLIGGLLGLPLWVLAREQRHTRLNRLLNSYREMAGCRVITKGFGTRQIVRALRAGEMVGMLADQDAGRQGTFVDFFGRPTSTHSGAFVFARSTGSYVAPAFFIRKQGPYHRICIPKMIELKKGDGPEAIRAAAQEYSAILESLVRQHPTQWLWAHKRWKSTTRKGVLILNDGTQGHLNQSLAVARIIQRYRHERGFNVVDTPYSVVDVEYKNQVARAVLALCSYFSSSACQGCVRCLKSCLTTKSYQGLISVYADIVISCGSSLAAVNIFMARELNAKNIIVMKPNGVDIKKFSLALIPRHDDPPARTNVLETLGSPNTFSAEYVRRQAERLSPLVSLSRPVRVGVLLGGDNAEYTLTAQDAKDFVDRIKEACERMDLELLVTTSRRTPKNVEALLKGELGRYPRCRLLVIANEKNIEGAVPAIVGFSTVVVVSGESTSMVSEAASAGKHVLVFPLTKKGDRPTKHERFVAELARQGFVKVISAGEIESAIAQAAQSKTAPKRLNDDELICRAVGTLL